MAVLWRLGKKLGNAAIVDVAWSALIAFCALFYLGLNSGNETRRVLASAVASLWGFRLSLYIFYRNLVFKEEDKRYTQLKKNWGAEQNKKMLYFYFMQGIAAALFSIPFLLMAQNTDPQISFLEKFGFGLFVIALVGESLADFQLHKFKANPDNQGKTCKSGLWRYSRHPNYFFEWLVWVSIFVFSLSSPFGWTTIFAPLLMYHFLVNVTGIPKAEEGSLKSRGDEYRQYQKETSKFFPWFVKG